MHPTHLPPPVHIEQKADRAGTVALWLIILMIGGPILMVVLCCVGCFGLGGLGMLGIDPAPAVTPTP
jgi:hypothetical protein